MRKIAAALAALLVLILGLVTSTAAAQDDRRAEGASVRASLVIHHVVQEGENLTTDDGLYGEGGIMQHYFGRHRRGDIARLRAYDGNIRVIRVARCDWPDEIPVEERTTLQECPNEYATYTIRRAVGRSIEIPMRWVPTRRLAELLGVTPGVARDMRRIAASVTLPPGSGADDADDAMNGEDPLVDAPTGAVAGTEPEGAPDAGTERLAEDDRDAGTLLAGGTGGTGGHEHVGGGSAPSDDGGLLTGVAVVGTVFLACVCLLLLIAFGVLLWELTPLVSRAIWKGLVYAWSKIRRRWKAYGRLRRQKAIAALTPYDPETDPRTFKIRQQREAYRTANGDLELEKAAALTRAGTAGDERDQARREKDGEQRSRNIAEDTLLKVADAFGLNPKYLFTVGPERKLLANVILDHLRQGATLLQKVADWTQPASPWEFALAGEAFDLKVKETRDVEVLATRAIARVRVWGRAAIARTREIAGLNQGFSEHLEQASAEYLELLREKDGLVQRVIQTENQLRANGIEPLPWPPIASAPAEEPAAGLPDVPRHKPQRNDEKTEVVFGAEAFARETERQARAAEEPAELEGEPTNAGFRIEDLDGAPKADDPPGESTRTGTTLQGMQAVSGDAPSQPPLPEIAPDKTAPGVGISGSEGMPQGVAAASGSRSTLGYERIRSDQTGPIVVPPPGALPNIAPDADPEDDEDEEDVPHDNGSGNGSSPPSRTQPVMCGCGQEISSLDWEAHAAKCAEADGAKLNSTDEPPSATGVQHSSKKKKPRERRKSS